ncbi:ABC transporter type 1, transmembrane domain-containing protein [Phascolomyces articulosus]|uniref:ABC transporter type 1, transmembrane domain-containing protein n=1 Tax=Phascolomyces articulosus TaxID=60185 RepID=A0AAD5JXK7_9FUNG|nr:ABC transporter type 1, transmembrane domain-containing protein [Phascolomyces articulosus]
MKFASPFCGCSRDSDPDPHTLHLDPCTRETRYRSWRSARYHHYDPHSLRLPTSKDAHLLRRSLILLVLILLEISCWAFLFAWRLESAILERGKGSNDHNDNSHRPDDNNKCGTPLYQVVDPGLALIPRLYMLILVIKSFTTPADPVSPAKFTLYNPHYLIFYTLASLSAIVRTFSYFITNLDDNWIISSTTEKSFAIVDLVICLAVWMLCATTPGELDQGELLDIDDADEGILVLHDGRVVRSGRILSLEASASPLASVTFSWMNSLLYSGYKKALDVDQLWALPFRQRAKENYRHFRNIARSSWGSKKSLIMLIYRANQKSIHFQFMTAILAVGFHYANPFFLYRLLTFIQTPEEFPPQSGYLYCVAIFVCNIISTLIASQTLLWGRRWHVTMNNMLNSEIYARTLKLGRRMDETSPSSSKMGGQQQEWSNGTGDMDENMTSRRASLMSEDTERLAELASYLHIFYTCPLEIIAGVVFLYYLLGKAFLAGLIVMVFALPSTHYISRKLVHVQKQLAEAKSWRIRLIKELVSNIRTTKFLAWERKWEQVITNARDDELVKLIKLYTQNTILSLIWFATPVFVTTISFAWYTLVEQNRLDPSTAFVSIVLFGMLRDPLNVMPQAVMAYNDARVSLGHIHAFLNSGEDKRSDPDTNSNNHEEEDDEDAIHRPYDERVKVGFDENSVFRWPTQDRHEGLDKYNDDPTQETADNVAGTTTFTLLLPKLIFPPGRLSVITGHHGSGKSSLLSALLGEMVHVSGKAYLPSQFLSPYTSLVKDDIHPSVYVFKVAYVPQTPWIQFGTVRDNILFFETWDDGRYRETLHQCDLLRDLSLLENGDLTLVGERGTPISETLKLKISLARAIYSRSKTVLIDDIFTQFDKHTAAHLHEKCISGNLLKARTVILASTQLGAWIRDARLLVRMDHGTVGAMETEEGIIDWIEINHPMRSSDDNTSVLLDDSVNDDRIDTLFESDPILGDDELFDEGSVMRESVRYTDDGMQDERKSREVAYATYFSICGGWQFWFAAALFTILARITSILESYWLKEENDNTTPILSNSLSTKHYVLIYLTICLVTVACNFIRTVIQYRGSLRASNGLFHALLRSICRAPLQFFDTTTQGQIMSRFSKDIETVDSSIGWHVNFLLQTTFGVLGVIITIGIILPEFYIACILAAICYFYIGSVYIRASRELKKLNAASRPPIYSFYTDTLAGLATIRAYREERAMMKKMFQLLDDNMRAFYTLWTTNRWLFVRVELVGTCLSFFIGILLIYKSTNAGLAGIALTFATSLLEYIYWLMRQSTTVDMHFEAIERINEYMDMTPEPPGIVEGSRPPAAWPTTGGVQARDLTVVLNPDGEQVLRHVSFNIQSCEKVAIVGRAGGEKSALVACFFRFVEPMCGSIKIDGVNIAWIGVEDLRSRITYISMEGMLLSGTVRSNLDPFGEYDDYELWQALQRVRLASPSPIPSSKDGSIIYDLDLEMGKEGTQLSVTERQLLCIARALLRDCTKFIIYEEAESSPEEQDKVHAVMRDEFEESTVLVIPHRLHTVTRYDRAMVFDQGVLVEFDTPMELLNNTQSLLRSLTEKAGVLNSIT